MSEDAHARTLQWFGRPHCALVYTECPEVARPLGAACIWCGVAIGPLDEGFIDAGGSISHRHCFLDAIMLPTIPRRAS